MMILVASWQLIPRITRSTGSMVSVICVYNCIYSYIITYIYICICTYQLCNLSITVYHSLSYQIIWYNMKRHNSKGRIRTRLLPPCFPARPGRRSDSNGFGMRWLLVKQYQCSNPSKKIEKTITMIFAGIRIVLIVFFSIFSWLLNCCCCSLLL